MDKAKAVVSDFMKKAGHHDTTVHERVAPAVTHETVVKQRHEEIQTAVDKEIHQDHYHTSVQPIKAKEVLPERHTHNMTGVEHRTYEHGNDREIAARLEREAAQFKDRRVEGGVSETRSQGPTIVGEHIHHHVHETIQPVVQKETIQPTVIHTTIPVHEVHHNPPQHHAASALPAVSLEEFKAQGGTLSGREERYDGFEGEPKSVGKALSNTQIQNGSYTATSNGHSTGLGSSTGGTSTGSNLTGTSAGTTRGTGATLREKLDPRVDADGDGKAGIMD